MLQLSVEQKKRKEQRKKSRFNDSTKLKVFFNNI